MTKDEIDELRDPVMSMLERILENRVKKDTTEFEEKFDLLQKKIQEKLDKLEKEGKIKSEVRPDGSNIYYSVNEEKQEEEPTETETEDSTPNFVMTKEDFVKFIGLYKELMNSFAKVKHIFGVDFNANGANWSFYDKTNEIIWGLLGCIFGKDNLDDISDFCFGDSNFDSAEQLYDELT